jgi:hypothetical protein
LLVPNISIGGEEQFESAGFGGVQQLAVPEGIPAKGTTYPQPKG